MKLKNLIVVCGAALCLIGFTGCNKNKKDDVEGPALKETTKRTVLMYLFQDTNLNEELTQNINDLEVGWNPDIDGTMLVYVDPSTHMTQFDGKPVLLEIIHDSSNLIVSKIVKVYDDADATSTAVFRKVQEDAIAMFPAEHYGIIISGHGNGFFVTDPAESKGISGSDRWSANSLDVDVIAKNTLVHYDFMIFDACLMGESTALYQLRNVTDFVVASVELSPGAGFDYQRGLGALFTLPKADLHTFARSTASFFLNDPKGKIEIGKDGYMTIGVYRMSAMEKLAEATKNAVTKLKLNYNDLRTSITEIIEDPKMGIQGSMFYPNDTRNFPTPLYYDFGLLHQLLINEGETALADVLWGAISNVVTQNQSALTDGFNANNPGYEEMTANMAFFIPRTFDPTLKFQDVAFYTRFEWSAASGFTNEWE